MNKRETLGLYSHICKICGKKFECTTEYVYKRPKKHDSYFYFCSYKCLREYDNNKSKEKYKCLTM